jgi:subtilase family serine protease
MLRCRPVALCLLILSTLLLSSPAFAAAHDRITSAINSSHTVVLTKSQHPKAQPRYDRGAVDPSFLLGRITLLTAPSPSQQKELNQLLAQQQDSASPNYHKWLTPQQYAARFGLSQNDLNRITNWLRSEGFQIVSVGGGRNTVAFSGTAAQVEHAFGTEIHTYEVDGAQHFANSTPLRVPAALKGIVTGVMGLHSFLPRPATGGKRFGPPRGPHPAYYDGNFVFPNFLAPGDIATIYDIPSSLDGTGQQLAVVGQTDIYLADINDFRSGFGLSTIPVSSTPTAGACEVDSSGVLKSCDNATNFAYVFVPGSGVTTDPGAPSTCGDLGEADLDIEWSGAVARNAQIIYVNSPVVYDSNCNYVSGGGIYDALTEVISPTVGTAPLATVVSMSYGYCEIGAPDLESLLQQGNAEGVTIWNSTGDVGSAACDYGPPSNSVNYPYPPYLGAQYGLAVSYPASSPEVTGVGGTGISLANDSYPTQSPYWSTSVGANGGTAVCPGGSCVPEIPWNDNEGLAKYCQSPASGDTFCTTGRGTLGWVSITSAATAQEDIWIYQGGGGASNCWYVDGNGVCLGAGGGSSNGGGFDQPSYQNFSPAITGAPTGVRYVPDVSLMSSPTFPGYIWCTPQEELGGISTTSTCANGIFDAIDTYESIVGGTSAATPVFAGIVTLLNQYVVAQGIQTEAGLGNINPQLYKLAASNSTNHAFHQITTGDNKVYCQAGQPNYPPDPFPSGVVCPSSGVFGFDASNSDATTGYNLVTGLGSVDTNNLFLAWASTALASTSTTLTADTSSANFGSPVTFTATVATTGSTTPGGTVTFYNGTSSIGTASLNAGSPDQATLTTSSLPSGTDSITATYGGDTKNASSTSTVLTETINPPTFSMTTPTTPPAVLAGLPTTSTFTVSPTSAGTFAGNVTFACSNLPDTTVACSFNTGQTNPAQIAAGTAGAVTVTLTISTSGPNTAESGIRQRRADNRPPWLPLTLPLAGIVMAGFAGRKLSKYSVVASLCVALALAGLLIACGSSAPPVAISVTPAGATVYPNYATDSWPNQAASFTATVTNSSNTAVSWTLSSGAVSCTAASSPCGSITSSGAYTAPTIATGLPASVTATATAQADSTKTATATVTLKHTTVPTAVYGAPYSITVGAMENGNSTPVTKPVSLTVD